MPTIRQLEEERGGVGRTVRFGPYAGAQVLSVRVSFGTDGKEEDEG